MSRKVLAGLIALVLVGGISDAGARAGGGSHVDGASAVSQYAVKLRPIALQVFTAVLPVDGITYRLGNEPPELIYPAKDAYVLPGPGRQLRAAERRLRALHPPPALAAQQAGLVSAVTAMDRAVTAFKRTSKVTKYIRLLTVYRENASVLQGGEGDWDTALGAAFKLAGQRTPNDFDRAYPHRASRELWVFDAGRSCLSAEIGGFRVAVDLKKSPTSQRVFTDTSRLLNRLGTALTGFRRPTGANALPPTIVSHLRILHFTATLFLRLHREILAHNRDQLLAGLSQISELSGSFEALSVAMGKYGSSICQREIAEIGQVGGSPTSGGNPSQST